VVKLTDSNDYLLCPEPGCGTTWTHIESVVARTRPHEDGPVTYREVTMGGKVSPPSPEYDDPFEYENDRRDTVIIFANCESGHDFAIRLRQHKGQTEVGTKSKGWR
jgi:hypothetical protein